MNKKKNKQQVKPGKDYKVTFGVGQTEKINEAANRVNETPREFLVRSATDKAKEINALSENDS